MKQIGHHLHQTLLGCFLTPFYDGLICISFIARKLFPYCGIYWQNNITHRVNSPNSYKAINKPDANSYSAGKKI